MLDKSSTEFPNWQVYYKDIYDQNQKLIVENDKLKEQLRLSKSQLEIERRNSRDLKTEKTNYFSKRSQIEELFLSCIEEVRKDIQRRKAVTLAKDANLNSSLHAKRNRKIDDSLSQAINNEQFTAPDKRKVIDLLLSNENVLLFLYEKLFPR